MSEDKIHRKNYCRLCLRCLTCPRELKSYINESECKCPIVNIRIFNNAYCATQDQLPRLSYRTRKFTPEIKKTLNQLIKRFSLKGRPLTEKIIGGNLCSTCQQRLRRARLRHVKKNSEKKYNTRDCGTNNSIGIKYVKSGLIYPSVTYTEGDKDSRGQSLDAIEELKKYGGYSKVLADQQVITDVNTNFKDNDEKSLAVAKKESFTNTMLTELINYAKVLQIFTVKQKERDRMFDMDEKCVVQIFDYYSGCKILHKNNVEKTCNLYNLMNQTLLSAKYPRLLVNGCILTKGTTLLDYLMIVAYCRQNGQCEDQLRIFAREKLVPRVGQPVWRISEKQVVE